MINQSANYFYIRFLFKIDALPQDVVFLLYINATFFKNLSPNVRDFLILEGVQSPPGMPTENSHQGNQRLLLVRNVAVEAEKNCKNKSSSLTRNQNHHSSLYWALLVCEIVDLSTSSPEQVACP